MERFKPSKGPLLIFKIKIFLVIQFLLYCNTSKMRKKKKYELEYSMNTSPEILYARLSSAGGLAEWFADDVNVDGNIFTFFWAKTREQAKVLLMKENKLVRFHWLEDKDKKSFFEFKITEDELTGDVSLIVTDFAEDDEISDSIDLWNKQIAELKHVIGL